MNKLAVGDQAEAVGSIKIKVAKDGKGKKDEWHAKGGDVVKLMNKIAGGTKPEEKPKLAGQVTQKFLDQWDALISQVGSMSDSLDEQATGMDKIGARLMTDLAEGCSAFQLYIVRAIRRLPDHKLEGLEDFRSRLAPVEKGILEQAQRDRKKREKSKEE